jgi:carboxypeptidase Taq
MTTRIHPHNVLMGLGAVLHEAGHALYEQGLPASQYGSPLGEALALGIHESQSRLWETLVGQSLPFWQHFFPLLQREFPSQLQSVPLYDFYRALNAVKPGLIRIDADEVSYNLHVLIRFEIEKELIEGSLRVKDIPNRWNSAMRDALGIAPSFDGQGCLQDIHWSLGFIGYFPTYTLGNLFSVQFFDAFTKQHPQWEQECAAGSLSPLVHWLRQEIHSHGRQYTSQELCHKVTGRDLSEQPYMDYLSRKYRALYNLT